MEREELSKLATQIQSSGKYVTRTHCHAQQRLLKLLRQKLVQTEGAFLTAIRDKETVRLLLNLDLIRQFCAHFFINWNYLLGKVECQKS